MSVPADIVSQLSGQNVLPFGPPRGNDGGLFQEDLIKAKQLNKLAESINIAKKVDEQERISIADLCNTDYENDESTRLEWLEMHAKWIRMYFLKDKPVNPPWPNSSEECMPILIEGCNQFHARAFKAFFSNPKFVAALPIGKASRDDELRAQRVGNFMSWQLGIRDKSYINNKDKLLKALPLHGSYFTKTYRDPINKVSRIENIRPMELVVPYGAYGTDIEELERKTQICYLSIRKAKNLFKKGFFLMEPEEWNFSDINPVQEAVNKATGITEPAVKNGYCKILEQHRYLDLNNDGIEEPYIVWIDGQSRKLLRIAIRYNIDTLGDIIADKTPIEYYTHYVYLSNPDGFYGLGLGHMTGSINSAVNKILRQSIDAGTLQNARPGFASSQAGLPKGELQFKLGKIMTVDSMIEDIRKGIMFLDHPGPSPALIELMKLLTFRADRLNMVTDLITGQAEKVYQPTTVMAEIEQALETFTAVQTRVFLSLKSELEKLYRLNSMHLDEEQYFAINDAMGTKEYQVFRNDFADDLQIIPSMDIKNSNERSRINKAALTMDFSQKSPLIMSSPLHIWEASRRYLEALGETDIEKLLPNPQILQQKEQQMQAMVQKQQQDAMELETSKIAQKQQSERIDDQIELEKLNLQKQELEIKRMQAQASILSDEVKSNITAEKEKNDLLRALVEYGLKAAEIEAKITALKQKGESDDSKGKK